MQALHCRITIVVELLDYIALHYFCHTKTFIIVADNTHAARVLEPHSGSQFCGRVSTLGEQSGRNLGKRTYEFTRSRLAVIS